MRALVEERLRLSRRQLLLTTAVCGLGLRKALLTQDWLGVAQAPSHGHLSRFVAGIRVPEVELDRIQQQRDAVRSRIANKSRRRGVRLAETPNAGSYAKSTALRRYMYGSTKIGGADVDLPFMLTARSGEDLDLPELLDLFEQVIRESYPRSNVQRTKSSIKLTLESFKYPFDVVPMVAISGAPGEAWLFRSDDTKVRTSVSRHVGFVTERSERSTRSPGPVRFNELIQLLKWWAAIQAANEEILLPPSFLLELLAAKVFDRFGVASNYTDTLATTFAALSEIIRERQTVSFGVEADERSPRDDRWRVLDPVNGDNSVVPTSWTEADIDRLARACEAGRQIMDRVRELDERDRGREVLETLRLLFGPALGKLGVGGVGALDGEEWG